MITFRDDAAVARSSKWQIRLLSRTSFTLAPGHRAVLIIEPWVCIFCWAIVIYFYRSVFQAKPNFYFDGLPWIPLQFCVYDITLVLLKSNGKMLMKWLSEQFWRCCSCWNHCERHAHFSLCVVNKTTRYREQTAPYTFESLSRTSNTDQSAPLLVEQT